MSLDAWIALSVACAVFPLMALTRLGPDMVLMGALVVLLSLGVIDAEQALGGFSNSGLFTVAFLYIQVASLRDTGGIDLIIRHVLGRPSGERHALSRLVWPVTAVSGLLNNTPVVATFIPAVISWGRRFSIAPQLLLMPLSFASILGGTVTLMGTSTNLVVHSLMQERFPDLHLGLFEIAWVGVPMALVGVVYLLVVTPRLLSRRPGSEEAFANLREFTIEMEVDPQGPLVDRTVEEAGLRHLSGLFLVEIERGGNVVSVVGPGERLKGGDHLVFAGTTEGAVELQQMRGLRPSRPGESHLEKEFRERRLVEAVVSDQCQFIGQKIRDGHFRTLYGAAVLAVCRGGRRVAGSLGQIRLQPSDVLLLEARPAFIERHRQSQDFLLISQVNGQARPAFDRALRAWAILATVVVLASTGLMSMMNAAMLGATAALLSGCVSVRSARRGMDTQVLLTIAASFGLGAALQTSGAADVVARGLLSVVGDSPWALLVGTYCVVALLTSLVTNNAAAVITFPIAMAGAESLGVNPLPYVVVVMFAASASFLTPIGYQTNLMVMGPGGYRVQDYLKLGGPLNLLTAVVVLTLTPFFWPF